MNYFQNFYSQISRMTTRLSFSNFKFLVIKASDSMSISVRVCDSKFFDIRSHVRVRVCVHVFKFFLVHIRVDKCLCGQ